METRDENESSSEPKTFETEQGRVVLVPLDISKNDKNEYKSYSNLTAHEKVDWISKRIEALCNQLQDKEKDAMWVFGWHEYGLFEKDSRSVGPDVINHLKEAMIYLTSKYPNLVVLAPVAHIEPCEDQEQLKLVQAAYQDPIVQLVRKQEMSESDYKPDHQVNNHEAKLKELIENPTNQPLHIAHNSIFCFQNGDIQTHDKAAPMDEILETDHFAQNTVFQPGSGEKAKPFFVIKHPITKNDILLAAESCRENNCNLFLKVFSTLKAMSSQKKLPQEPLLHLIFSDDVKLTISSIHAKYAMQFDSAIKPRLITSSGLPQDQVKAYRNNLVSQNDTLVGPLQSLYPFEKRVLAEIDRAIKSFPNNHPKRTILTIIKNEFMECTDIFDTFTLTKSLVDLLNKYKKELCEKEEVKSKSGFLSTLVSKFSNTTAPPKPINMDEFIQNLITMAGVQRKEYPGLKDICSQTEAPLLADHIKHENMPSIL